MSNSAGVLGCEDSGEVRLWVMGSVPSVGVLTEETVGLFGRLNCCEAAGVVGVDVRRPWWFCMLFAMLTLSGCNCAWFWLNCDCWLVKPLGVSSMVARPSPMSSISMSSIVSMSCTVDRLVRLKPSDPSRWERKPFTEFDRGWNPNWVFVAGSPWVCV